MIIMRHRAFGLMTTAVLALGASVHGQEDRAAPDDADFMKPTSLGIRLTPELAGAMSKRFVQEMVIQYELGSDQAEVITGLMTRSIMRFAHQNEKTGQQMIEFMMTTMLENDNRFSKEAAQEFARMSRPLIPNLQEFFTKLGADIGQEMSLGQRMKFTADMAAAAAGITIFEARMKRWEEGKIGPNANPFWDPADKDPSLAHEVVVEDPNEHPSHRRARLEVERWTEWELRLDDQWGEYIKQAAQYYEFDEAQNSAAESILKQCRERAAAIKTPEWMAMMKQNRIAKRLARMSEADLRQGPVVFALDRDYNRYRKPLLDLDEEFKKRIDEIPDSKQRAAAQRTARKFLADRGMKQPPI